MKMYTILFKIKCRSFLLQIFIWVKICFFREKVFPLRRSCEICDAVLEGKCFVFWERISRKIRDCAVQTVGDL